MSDFEDNLDTLRDAVKDLSLEQQREFEDYFIGALSATTKLDTWKEAIASARRCYESNALRRDAERKQESL